MQHGEASIVVQQPPAHRARKLPASPARVRTPQHFGPERADHSSSSETDTRVSFISYPTVKLRMIDPMASPLGAGSTLDKKRPRSHSRQKRFSLGEPRKPRTLQTSHAITRHLYRVVR